MNDDLDIFTSPGEIFADFTQAVKAGNQSLAMHLFARISQQRVEEAAWLVVNHNTPWVSELIALRPHENYVGVVNKLCNNTVEHTHFNTACKIFLSTATQLTEACALFQETVFSSLDPSLQKSLIERLKQEPPELALNIIMRSNLGLFNSVWDTLKKSFDIDKAIETIAQHKKFNRLANVLVEGNATVVWEVIYSSPKTWVEFLRASLAAQEFGLAQSLLNFADGQAIYYTEQLNEILCTTISNHNLSAVKMLPPYYDCFYQEGLALKRASAEKNADIFDAIYEATAPETRSEILAKMSDFTPKERQMLEDHLNSERVHQVLTDTIDAPTHKVVRKM